MKGCSPLLLVLVLGAGWLASAARVPLSDGTVGASSVTKVRLVNGGSYLEGRLETQIGGKWGTVCMDQFNAGAAQVACRMMGLAGGVPRFKPAWGKGSLPKPIVERVVCKGNESSLAACTYKVINVVCDTGLAGIACTVPPIIYASLETFYNGYEGFLVLVLGQDGQPSYVCRKGLNLKAVELACRAMGMAGGTILPTAAGYNNLPIKVGDLQCTGKETNLTQCKYTVRPKCDATDRATIRCEPLPSLPVRMVGGPSYIEGRLEANIGNHWGAVCSAGFDVLAAQAVCRSLNLEGGSVRTGNAYGVSATKPMLTKVKCPEGAYNLASCTFSTNAQCTDKVGVKCKLPPVTEVYLWTPDNGAGDGRIASPPGTVERIGRLEVRVRDNYGTVCSNLFTDKEATVACRQYSNNSAATGRVVNRPNYRSGDEGFTVMDRVVCTGNEKNLSACFYHTDSQCKHPRDVVIACTVPNPVTAVRLVGSTKLKGRLEVQLNGQWGSVCDDGFEDPDAQVVCRMLGLAGGTAYGEAKFGQSKLPIVMSNVNCDGTEANLGECTFYSTQPIGCGHSEDVGVECEEP